MYKTQTLLYNFFILFFIAASIQVPVHAQQQFLKSSRKHIPSPTREYIHNKVIVKFKKTVGLKIAQGGVNAPLLSTLKKDLSITEASRMFPTAKAPLRMKTNKMGQPFVDLSNTYVINYSSNVSIEEVIAKLLASGNVEYAEPYYIDQVLYVPNDPYADSISGQQSYYLNAMQYYQALNVAQGDTNIVIGIIDTGVKQDHEDLKDNIKYNYADPINGIDDDGDGFIDNFAGWDLGNNDGVTMNPSSEHGCSVAGTAGARTNNGIGIAGTGYKCKILPIKASTDASGGSVSQGYNGIIYAADHGCKVMNLSWGGPGGYSQTAQEVINYAAINHDVVIVAAAGNDNHDVAYYPAAYDNVLSVAALETKYISSLDTTVEIRAYFATYNYTVDVCAQGVKVAGTNHSPGGYSFVESGSSFSSPLVAGAAGLVRSKYPTYNALQVAELLRVSSDPLIDTIAENKFFKDGKLGKGRINIYRAVTDTKLPAIRLYKDSMYTKYGNAIFGGDTISFVGKFRNYLRPTNNATVTISMVSNNASILQDNFTIGVLGMMDSTSNKANPFKIKLNPTSTFDDQVTIRLDYNDPVNGYSDFQYLTFIINPSYIDIDINQVTLTVTSKGMLGYFDVVAPTGDGFLYKGEQLLYEGGLMISSGKTKVADCVRGNPMGTIDNDFTFISNQKYASLPEGDQGAKTILRDRNTADSIGLIIEQRSYAFKNSPNDKYVILEYQIQNVSGDTLDSLYVGIYNDWDIQNSALNKGNWDNQDSVGYTYYNATNGLYAGVSLLTNNAPSCFTLDHSNAGGNNINPNDGFSTVEKYNTLSQGITIRPSGGVGSGNDISQVVGASAFKIPNNAKITIAFAMVAGDNLTDLKSSARNAKNTFRFYNTSATPVVSNLNYCKGDTLDVLIAPGNGTNFNFYNSPSASTPIGTGPSLDLTDVSKSQTIYVQGIDSLFSSSKVPVTITLHADVTAKYGYIPQTVDLDVTPNGLAYFVSSSINASKLSWDMGDGTIYDNVTSVGHNFTTPGVYKVILTALDSYNCKDTVSHIVNVIGTFTGISESFDADGLRLFPNPVNELLTIQLNSTQAELVRVDIYNALGQPIESYKSNNAGNSIKIPVAGKSKGIYYAKINMGSKVLMRKFTIE